MSCNEMFREYCKLKEDHYNSCENHPCLIELLGISEMLACCSFIGLDKKYPEIYEKLSKQLKK